MLDSHANTFVINNRLHASCHVLSALIANTLPDLNGAVADMIIAVDNFDKKQVD